MSAKPKFEHILITGASGGIGAALARSYAGPGVTLSLTGRDEARLQKVAEACQAQGAQTHQALVDVTNAPAMAAFIVQRDQEKILDLVIANAGISGGTGGDPGGESAAQARRIFDVNLEGVLNTIDPIVPRMLARGHGQIALMSSLAAFRGWPGAPAYCASKAAVRIYGEALRGALTKSGVHASVICPGFVVSEMTGVNDFKMPLLMDADRAAKIIRRGLEKNRGRIAFPFSAYFIAWLLSLLPDSFAQIITQLAPSKPSRKST